MKNIKFQDPQTSEDMEVELSSEEYNHQQAWRVKFKDGKSTLIGLDQHRIWKQFEGNELDSSLISNIGKAIESQENPSY
jgi:hypothetical protein